MLEEKIKETERTAELAEADAREKDKELIETLKRVKDYETVCLLIRENIFQAEAVNFLKAERGVPFPVRGGVQQLLMGQELGKYWARNKFRKILFLCYSFFCLLHP